jgi:hypothetical protein
MARQFGRHTTIVLSTVLVVLSSPPTVVVENGRHVAGERLGAACAAPAECPVSSERCDDFLMRDLVRISAADRSIESRN